MSFNKVHSGFKVFILFLTALTISSCAERERYADDEITELRFWHGIESPENNLLLEEKIKTFEERNPHINIILENIGAQDSAMPSIMTALSADRQPELLWFAPVYTGRMAESGKLYPAEKFIENDTEFNPEDIYEGILESGRYDGRIYTVPFETNCLAFYYNKEHFSEAGIERYPQSWKELRQTARKLTRHFREKGEDSFGMLIPLGTQEWTVWTWQNFLWQAGGEFLSDNMKEPGFNGRPGVEALKFWKKLVYEDESAVFSERNAGYKIEPFIAGKVSMMINGPWNYPELKEQDEINYGSFPLPENEKKATNIGGENLFIFRSTPEKEEASWEFAKFIMSEEFQAEWAMNTGYLPVNRKAAESEKYRRFLEENPFIKTFVYSMEFGKSRPPVKEYSRISERLGRALENALYRRKTPEEALNQAAEDSEDLL